MRDTRWHQAQPIIEPQINAEGKHIWPFDPALPIDIRHLIFDRQGEIRMNRHDYLELLLVHSGEIAFQVQDRSCTFSAGDLFVMGPTLYHRPIRRDGPPVKAVTLFFLPEAIHSREVGVDEVEYLMPFFGQDASFPHVIPKKSGVPLQVRGLIDQIETELAARSPHSRLYAKTCLKMILALLVRHYAPWLASKKALDRKERDLARLRPLFDYMDGHFQQRINLHEAAGLAHMSKSHFIRFFKQVTSHSFAEYLNHFRIAKAQVLLRTTDKAIAEIAWESGFCDQSHFGTVFRKFVRMTPQQFRQGAVERAAQIHPAEIPMSRLELHSVQPTVEPQRRSRLTAPA